MVLEPPGAEPKVAMEGGGLLAGVHPLKFPPGPRVSRVPSESLESLGTGVWEEAVLGLVCEGRKERLHAFAAPKAEGSEGACVRGHWSLVGER